MNSDDHNIHRAYQKSRLLREQTELEKDSHINRNPKNKIDIDKIDIDSLKAEYMFDVDPDNDLPRTRYFFSGKWKDGRELTDDELEDLASEQSDLLYNIKAPSFFYSKEENNEEKKLKYDYEIATAYLPRDLDTSTREAQNKVLELAFKEVVKRITNKNKNPELAARNLFYDEDFPMEVISQYNHYQKNGFPDVEENEENAKLADDERNDGKDMEHIYPAGWNKGFPQGIEIAAGGKEEPFLKDGKWYIRVFDKKNHKHFIYSYKDDVFVPEI